MVRLLTRNISLMACRVGVLPGEGTTQRPGVSLYRVIFAEAACFRQL